MKVPLPPPSPAVKSSFIDPSKQPFYEPKTKAKQNDARKAADSNEAVSETQSGGLETLNSLESQCITSLPPSVSTKASDISSRACSSRKLGGLNLSAKSSEEALANEGRPEPPPVVAHENINESLAHTTLLVPPANTETKEQVGLEIVDMQQNSTLPEDRGSSLARRAVDSGKEENMPLLCIQNEKLSMGHSTNAETRKKADFPGEEKIVGDDQDTGDEPCVGNISPGCVQPTTCSSPCPQTEFISSPGQSSPQVLLAAKSGTTSGPEVEAADACQSGIHSVESSDAVQSDNEDRSAAQACPPSLDATKGLDGRSGSGPSATCVPIPSALPPARPHTLHAGGEEGGALGACKRCDERVEAQGCQRCLEMQAQIRSLRDTTVSLGESAAAATEEAGLLREALARARDTAQRDDRLRAENERLLDVVFTLKAELDHQPLGPDILRELQAVKENLIYVTIERDEMAKEVSSLKRSIEAAPKRRAGFFG